MLGVGTWPPKPNTVDCPQKRLCGTEAWQNSMAGWGKWFSHPPRGVRDKRSARGKVATILQLTLQGAKLLEGDVYRVFTWSCDHVRLELQGNRWVCPPPLVSRAGVIGTRPAGGEIDRLVCCTKYLRSVPKNHPAAPHPKRLRLSCCLCCSCQNKISRTHLKTQLRMCV